MAREPHSRPQRVAAVLKQELQFLLSRTVSDPRLQSITITTVRVSKDIRLAKIYYTCRPEEYTLEDIQDTIENAASFLRREVGQRVTFKFTPELKFFYDDSLDYAFKIEEILKKIKEDEPSHEQ